MMSKSLKSFPPEVRKYVAHKRVEADTKGLGYWGAKDALKKSGTKL